MTILLLNRFAEIHFDQINVKCIRIGICKKSITFL